MQTHAQQASFSVSDMVRNAAIRKAELRRQQNPARLAEAGARKFDRCVRQMEGDMREIAAITGGVTDRDLILRGWTAEESEPASRRALAIERRARPC